MEKLSLMSIRAGVNACHTTHTTRSLYGLVRLERLQRMQSWPSVRGTVEESRLESWHRGTSTGTKVVVRPLVVVRYTVGQERYLSSTYGYVDRPPQQIVETYPPGTEVEVFYDPRKPEDAVLNNLHPVRGAMVIAGLGVLFTAIAAVAIRARWPGRQSRGR